MAAIALTPLPPAEAIGFFASKGFAFSFNWRDVWQEEHARAFTVAKVMRLDILEDIRREVDLALRNGTTLREFQKNLTPLLQSKGWWGKQILTDPVTGEQVLAQLGSPRRLRTIFEVNLRTANAAGRWSRIERLKKRMPFLAYSAILDSRVRPLHRSWHQIILPVDHPWWNTHYPPNGWNCRCIVTQLSQRMLDKRGLKVTALPPGGKPVRVFDPRVGKVIDIHPGIDKGWNYNVGKAHMRGLTPPSRSGPL